jgi:peroxiredoxin
VQGTRVTRGGGVAPVSADDCPLIVVALPVVPGLPTPPLPCRRPLLPLLGAAPEKGVEVVGHYDPWTSGRAPSGGPTNMLVHFAQGRWAETARALEQALAATKRHGALVVVGVLESGELTQATHPNLDADVTLLLTDDPARNWASAFGVPDSPATVLIGPDGRVRAKDDGPLDPRKLSKLLDKQLEPGGEVSWRPLRLALPASGQAPDAPLRLGDGRELALRRLRGGPVVLSFWTSCSEPSVEQLRQLREALESGADQPYVLGIGDGESPQQVAELAKRERLPFPLVPDPERVIARRYGVASWPTTVQLGPDGRVAATDLGLVPGRSPCDLPPIVGVHSTAERRAAGFEPA